MVFFLSATRWINKVAKFIPDRWCRVLINLFHSKVRYPEDEDRQVLQLKKAVTSSFSLRLHNYVKNKGAKKLYGGWTYRVPDLDHSGAHSARLVLCHMLPIQA